MEPGQRPIRLSDYLAIFRRRKWIFIQALVLVPAAAYLISTQQTPEYSASSEVLLSRQNVAAALSGIPNTEGSQNPERMAETQSQLARVPELASRVLRTAGLPDRSEADFLAASAVGPKPNTDILVFEVVDRNADVAARLATAYAREFTRYRYELDTQTLEGAQADLDERIEELKAEGVQPDSTLYGALVEKQQQLELLRALQTQNTLVVKTATDADQTQPRPRRNAALGIFLGGLLGLGLVFLWESLDSRVRSESEIAEQLSLPLLARLAAPQRELRRLDKLVMLSAPNSREAEAFRTLRTNLQFLSLEHGLKSVMVTSASAGEGKSTTVANLAVALARDHQRVVLVDLDLRNPSLDRLFKLAPPGLTDVALGKSELEHALKQIPIPEAWPKEAKSTANGAFGTVGRLEVLPCGVLPPNPGEFVSSKALAAIIDRLRERADMLLLDVPPLVPVGDAIPLSSLVDAILVVSRVNFVHRGALAELRRLLDIAPARKLGFVLTGRDPVKIYGAGTHNYYRSPEREPSR